MNFDRVSCGASGSTPAVVLPHDAHRFGPAVRVGGRAVFPITLDETARCIVEHQPGHALLAEDCRECDRRVTSDEMHGRLIRPTWRDGACVDRRFHGQQKIGVSQEKPAPSLRGASASFVVCAVDAA